MIRNHLRSNIVGYLAVFMLLSGTAIADHPGGADTINSRDIIDGQVKTKDISNSNGVRSEDVRNDNKTGGGLAAIDLARDSVGSSEIAADAVGASEIGTDSVDGDAIQNGSVGRSDIAPGSVGAVEVGDVHEHESLLSERVEDGVAHDGAYGIGSVVVSCIGDREILLSASIDWIETQGHNEVMLSEVTIERAGTDSAVVKGAFDGGGGASNPARYHASATCLGG